MTDRARSKTPPLPRGQGTIPISLASMPWVKEINRADELFGGALIEMLVTGLRLGPNGIPMGAGKLSRFDTDKKGQIKNAADRDGFLIEERRGFLPLNKKKGLKRKSKDILWEKVLARRRSIMKLVETQKLKYSKKLNVYYDKKSLKALARDIDKLVSTVAKGLKPSERYKLRKLRFSKDRYEALKDIFIWRISLDIPNAAPKDLARLFTTDDIKQFIVRK